MARLGYPAIWVTDSTELWDIEQAIAQGIES